MSPNLLEKASWARSWDPKVACMVLDAGVPVRRRGGSRRHEFRRAQPLAPTFLRYRRRQGALLLADAARTQPLARPTGADGVHPQRFLAVLPHRAERK